MNVREIVADWLKTHGYDGLVDGDEDCGCEIDDLMPCGEWGSGCVAGHKRLGEPGSGYDFMIIEGPDPEKGGR